MEHVLTEIEYVKPRDIEARSMEIIEQELREADISLSGSKKPTILRAIHTSADFDYARTLYFSEGAVDQAVSLLKSGATIVTDTNMALAGINKRACAKLGCEVRCFMADPDVAREARERQITRAAVSMERASRLEGPVIFAIGNAPTALLLLYDMIQEESYRPAFIIGVPVGFVNVVAAKERIISCDVQCIVNRGRKGGSNIAAAIVNSLLYQIEGTR